MLEHAKALVEPTAREVVERLLDRTGVQINGPNPWDIEVHDDDLYARVLAHGSLGLGEAYMEGWWDAEALDVCLFRLMRAKLDLHVLGLDDAIAFARAHLENLQKRSRAFEVGERHYNVGNDLYERMLGKRLVYSCAYFADTDDLDEAHARVQRDVRTCAGVLGVWPICVDLDGAADASAPAPRAGRGRRGGSAMMRGVECAKERSR